MPSLTRTEFSDRVVWILIQIGIVFIPIDIVVRVAGVRLTVCEGIFSFALVVWAFSGRMDLKRIFSNKLFIPMAIFVLASAISIPAAQNTFAAVRETVQFLWMFSLFFLFLDFARGHVRVVRLVLLILLTVAWVSLFGLYQYFFAREPIEMMIAETRQRASAFYGQPNALGSYLIAVLPLLWSLCVAASENPDGTGKGVTQSKGLLYGILFLSSCGLAATFSRGSWLGLALGVVVLFLLFRKKADWRSLLVTILLVGIGFAAILLDTSFQPKTSSRAFSNRQRVLLLGTALRMFSDHPLVGVGSGNYPVRLMEYADQELIEMLYWDYDKERRVFYMNPKKEPDVELVHNVILQAAAENGIGGVLAMMWVFVLYFSKGWKMVSAGFESGHTSAHLRVGAFAGSVAVMGSGMLGWPFSHGVQEILLLTMAIAVTSDTDSGSE